MLAGLVILAFAGGCLVSGTEVFSIDIGDLLVTGGAVESVTVDLTENDTYEDHKDEIKTIDRVGFTTQIDNLTGTEAVIDLYFSATPGLANPAAEATPLFLDVTVPPGGRTITYDESLDFLLNFEELQTVVEGGAITFYSTANQGFNLVLNDVTMIVTFTVGL
jgi:hypothetical protein